MWPLLFFSLLTSSLTGFWVMARQYRGFLRKEREEKQRLRGVVEEGEARVDAQVEQIASLRRDMQRLEVEESRVFDFLHGLGQAVSDESRPHDLHRLIAEGAQRILDADAGAVDLADRKGDQPRPEYVSKGCPMFVELVGVAWKQGRAMRVEDDPLLGREGSGRPVSAMVSPLNYGTQRLGLLLVARGAGMEPFAPSAFKVFEGIAEQSAFALYNSFIFAEAAEKRRIEQDLQVAHEVQRILLPSSAPDVEGYEISGINLPARHVSGDYYDYLAVDARHCGVAIADVSGKGVSASLMMAMCRSVLRAQAAGGLSPSATLQQVNAHLYPDIREDMFISMAYVILDRESPRVTLCRAGHDAPLVYRCADRTVTKINPPGMALGIDSGGVFNRVTGDFSLTLEKGDCLILYTDGVTEALDRQGMEFGMENLNRSILASAHEGAAEIVSRLTQELRSFAGTEVQHDDVTVIVIRKK